MTMCGIAVAIDWEDAHAHVQRLIGNVLHRGDISDHIATPRANVAMGTRRLRIVDAAHGAQPQPSFDGKLLVSFNGEIYNHLALRAELEAMGIGFRTGSDTEVLANALRAWGAQALKRLRGMYAFVAYDVTNGEFLAARDPFGVKPLYLVQAGTGFLFCSEIRPLLKAAGTGDVMLLPPGHLLTRNFCTRFYTLPAPTQLGASSSDALDKILREAVESRLPPDLPVAGLFSGGIDSTLMMHYARRIRPEMPGYFIGEPDAPDYKYARAYAEQTGMDMREVTPPPRGDKLLALLQTVVEICESFEPSVVRPGLYSYLVSERIHCDGFRVALCGEGADELFAGYGPLEHTFAQGNTLGRHVQEQCLSFMHRANLQRVDRCSMRFELEIREPFLDLNLVEHAAQLDATALLAMVDGRPQGKQPLRAIYDLYPDALPREIRNRRKVQFDEGAGIASERTDWTAMFEDAVSDRDFADGRRQFAAYDIATKEELYYMRALAAAMDVGRLPHLKGRIRLCVPADTPAMPEALKRLAPSV
jgi:asparagine synthase (glutamine-hydrolysing)